MTRHRTEIRDLGIGGDEVTTFYSLLSHTDEDLRVRLDFSEGLGCMHEGIYVVHGIEETLNIFVALRLREDKLDEGDRYVMSGCLQDLHARAAYLVCCG